MTVGKSGIEAITMATQFRMTQVSISTENRRPTRMREEDFPLIVEGEKTDHKILNSTEISRASVAQR